jgi:hypothetical protein
MCAPAGSKRINVRAAERVVQARVMLSRQLKKIAQQLGWAIGRSRRLWGAQALYPPSLW